MFFQVIGDLERISFGLHIVTNPMQINGNKFQKTNIAMKEYLEKSITKNIVIMFNLFFIQQLKISKNYLNAEY